MIKRYYSSYTGKQIDDAVKAIVENQVKLEDLSPELIAEIKRWIATGEGIEGFRELHFASYHHFPAIGDPLVLYIATDEDKIYYWSNDLLCYKAINPSPEVIIGGGAQE